MGSRVLRGALVACALSIGLQPLAVSAQPRGDALKQCFGDVIDAEEAEMQCIKVGGGEWQPVGGSSGSGGASGFFGPFLFFGFLLSLMPAFVGVSISKDAGVSPLVGFAIGLFGSWIGVIVLYVGGKSLRQGASPVISVGSPASAPASGNMGPDVGSRASATPPEGSGVAERLKTLKDLLDQGLITQAEYDERRAAAISDL